MVLSLSFLPAMMVFDDVLRLVCLSCGLFSSPSSVLRLLFLLLAATPVPLAICSSFTFLISQCPATALATGRRGCSYAAVYCLCEFPEYRKNGQSGSVFTLVDAWTKILSLVSLLLLPFRDCNRVVCRV